MQSLSNLLQRLNIISVKNAQTLEEIRAQRTDAYKEYARGESVYRTLSALYIALLVVGGGLYIYRQTQTTPRAPFPPLPQTDVAVSVTVHVAISSSSLTTLRKDAISHLSTSLLQASSLASLEINWNLHSMDKLVSWKSVVEDKSAGSSSSLEVFVALIPSAEWKDFSANDVFLTGGKWALVQVRDEKDAKLLSTLHNVIHDVLVGLPHLELIVRRDRRERLEPWQIAAMSSHLQKRALWDSRALADEYVVRIVHVHEPSTNHPANQTSPCGVMQVVKELGRRVADVTTLTLHTEHLFDLDVSDVVSEDEQGRAVIDNKNLHTLLSKVDAFVGPTESILPQIKIAILHRENLFLLDKHRDDGVHGVSVAEWGGVLVRDGVERENALAILRVQLGIDSDLPTTFARSRVPLSTWELTRLRLRSIVDCSLKTAHTLHALHSTLHHIDTLHFSEDLSRSVHESAATLSAAFSSSSPSLPLLRRARTLAEEALFAPSLLSLLYFPNEQKAGIYLPVLALYFLPALFLIPRVLSALFSSIFSSVKK